MILARGRNNWFAPARLVVFRAAGQICIKLRSRRLGRKAPIIIQGDADEIQRLVAGLSSVVLSAGADAHWELPVPHQDKEAA